MSKIMYRKITLYVNTISSSPVQRRQPHPILLLFSALNMSTGQNDHTEAIGDTPILLSSRYVTIQQSTCLPVSYYTHPVTNYENM